MELSTNTCNKEISEEDVASYLKSHSGFFLKRDDLLMELQLSHPTGGAVSLLERQVSLLRERNVNVRASLNTLLNNAKNNEAIFDKTKKLILSILEAQGLDAIVNTVTKSLLNDFSMDFVSFTLFGNPHQYKSVYSRMTPIQEANQHISSLLKSHNTICGVLRPQELSFLFTEQHEQVGSAAVVPLYSDHPLGIIAIGNRDNQYFHSGMGTLFLSYIAEVLNRILPKLLQQ